MKKPKPKVVITLRLPTATVRALGKVARTLKITRTELIVRALAAELEHGAPTISAAEWSGARREANHG